MMQSMTGYSEQSFSLKTLSVKVSIKSLNHRYFDWNYKGTPLAEVENRLRSICQKKIHRGRLEVTLDLTFLDETGWELSINEKLLEKIISRLEAVSRKMGKEVSVSIDQIFRIPQLAELRRKDLSPEETAFLERCFGATLADVLKERRREGRETEQKLREHARIIRQSIRRVEKIAKKQPLLLREKIKQRLRELSHSASPSGVRLEEEVAYLAQRSDITEEILRLKSHLSSLEKLIRAHGGEPQGKMLDFIAQELYREANTINSKSQNLGMTKESLVIKGEVENIRQHIQNIE